MTNNLTKSNFSIITEKDYEETKLKMQYNTKIMNKIKYFSNCK